MVCLGQWAGVKARQHTTLPGASPAVANGYNSSASAVNAIFLMFNIFFISVLRAIRPALTIPGIQYTIFVMVGFIYGPQEATEYHSQLFLKELLYSFLTGQAISAGVSLLIIPVSSRKVFFGEATGFLQSSRGLLKAQLGFIQVLQHSGLSSPSGIHNVDASTVNNEAEYKQKVLALKSASSGLLSLGAKLREDVRFAKRELAIGHLRETDIHTIHGLLRDIMIPITGLSTIADIAERTHCGVRGVESPKTSEADTNVIELEGWDELFRGLTVSFETIVQILDESILHTLILFRLAPSPRKQEASDIETGKNALGPGDLKFGDYLEQRMRDFREERSSDLQLWAEERGLSSVFKNTAKHNMPSVNPDDIRSDTAEREILASRRLHIVLYMEYLLYSTGKAILALVRFAELKATDGTTAKRRLIVPAYKTLVKIVKSLINGDEPGPDTDDMEGLGDTVSLGDSFQPQRDPEHLPPKNARQAWGDRLRAIPKFLGSDAVRFGVRVTIAVMSIGIMAYLKNSHAFFVKQRVVWALVMIAIGMNPTAGSAVFNMLGNTTCTIFGMTGAYINWYMVDGKTAGVIVFFFFFLMFYFYFAAKFPRFLVAIVAGALTHVLVIGGCFSDSCIRNNDSFFCRL
jgi:Putative ER transporter, 6TM, N-terminal/Fusaric acid resistance protein-like